MTNVGNGKICLVKFVAGTCLCLILAGALSLPALALPAPATDAGERLHSAKHAVLALRNMSIQGVLTKEQAERGVALYLKEASVAAGHPVKVDELLGTREPSGQRLTAIQRFAGLINFVNIMWVLAIIGLIVSGVYLLGDFIVNMLKDIPGEVYEALLYVGSVGLCVAGRSLPPETAPYLGLTGCLLFAGALALSSYLHKLRWNFSLWFLLFAAWTVVALIYQSPILGFIAVIALIGALGFSVMVYPYMITMGFSDDESLQQCTGASLIILGIFVALRATNTTVPALSIFEGGALFMGSFVGYLGLLIASTRWYDKKSNRGYIFYQIAAVVAGILALFLGSVLNIPELLKIGGTFFVIYLLTKPYEIPEMKVRGFMTITLWTSTVIYFGCMHVKSHPELLRYLVWVG